jgi:hypothetical protein
MVTNNQGSPKVIMSEEQQQGTAGAFELRVLLNNASRSIETNHP